MHNSIISREYTDYTLRIEDRESAFMRITLCLFKKSTDKRILVFLVFGVSRCVYNSIISRENTDYTVRIEDGSLFCVYDDNSESAVFLFAVFVCFVTVV